MQQVTLDAKRSVFMTLPPSSLARVLNKFPNCKRLLTKATITTTMVNSDEKRGRVYATLLSTLRKDEGLYEALREAWLSEYGQLVAAVRELGEDSNTLAAFLSAQPLEMVQTLGALSLIPKDLPGELPRTPLDPQPHEQTVAGNGDDERINALRKELSAIRKQLKSQELRNQKEKDRLQHELEVSRSRLGNTRSQLKLAEQSLQNAGQERSSLKRNLMLLERDIKDKDLRISDLNNHVDQLSAELAEAREDTRRASMVIRFPLREMPAETPSPETAPGPQPKTAAPDFLALLKPAVTDDEQAELNYPGSRAGRSLKRALRHAETGEPADLLQVWLEWIQEEVDTVTLVTQQPGASVAEIEEQLAQLSDLDYQINLRSRLLKQLRLLTIRLAHYYAEMEAEKSLG